MSLLIGLYLFDNQALKDKIKSCATVCLTELQRLMPELIYKKANAFLAKMSDMSNRLSFTVTETSNQFVEQFVVYMENVNKIGGELDDHTADNSEIGALLYLILEFKLKISESYKNKVSEANSQIIAIRKKVEEANAAYDQNLTKCKRRLDKMVPELNSLLKEINEKVFSYI
jgi:dynein heavy chain, axonemal